VYEFILHDRPHLIASRRKLESRTAHGSARPRCGAFPRAPMASPEEAQNGKDRQERERQSDGQANSTSRTVGKRIQLTSNARHGLTTIGPWTVLTDQGHTCRSWGANRRKPTVRYPRFAVSLLCQPQHKTLTCRVAGPVEELVILEQIDD
jgi:hypothetical protein